MLSSAVHKHPVISPSSCSTVPLLQIHPRPTHSGTGGDICCPIFSLHSDQHSCESMPERDGLLKSPSTIRHKVFQRTVPLRWLGTARSSILTVEACRDPRTTLRAPIHWDDTQISPIEDFMILPLHSHHLLRTALYSTYAGVAGLHFPQQSFVPTAPVPASGGQCPAGIMYLLFYTVTEKTKSLCFPLSKVG